MRIDDNDALLVIDVQNDFCPGGALEVPDGDSVIPVINKAARLFTHVIMTQDWHPGGHSSFASVYADKEPYDMVKLSYGKQVLWLDHCVQGTNGAMFHQDIDIPDCRLIIRKGFRREVDSYSAFMENDHKTVTGLAGYLNECAINRVFITGLATDFCVQYSAMDAVDAGFTVMVIEDGCRGIDIDGSVNAAWDNMLAKGVGRINSTGLGR